MIDGSSRPKRNRLSRIACLLAVAIGVTMRVAPAQSPSDAAQNGPSFWFRLLIPDNQVPSQIGHASFRLGADMVLVFAARLPVQQAALQEVSGIAAATVVRLPDATILRIPLPTGQSIHAVPAAGSFHVVLGPPEKTRQATPSFVNGQIVFPTMSADRTVTYAPSASRTLLVGTVTSDVALGQTLAGPGYATIPAENGIVVATQSDQLVLMPGPKAFALHSSVQTLDLPVGNPPVSDARSAAPHLPTGLDLPHGTLVALRRRIEMAQLRVAHANSVDRVARSYRLAKTLISAGLGPEAEGVLTDLARRNPETVDDPQRRLLLDIANVVADRSIGKSSDWPTLVTSAQRDDEALWMGIARAETGDPVAASLLARSLAPLMALPRPVRTRILPVAAESLISTGFLQQAGALLQGEAGDHSLALANAELLQAEKHPHQALDAYRRLFAAKDQRTAGIARFRAIMLRYQLRQADAAVTAASLARHIYDWGGDRHALDMRLALAKMWARSGDFPRAFTLLTRADHQFPGAGARILHARQAMFGQMMTSGALDRLPAIAAVSILKNNIDLIPSSAAGIPALKKLSSQLIAIGLPDQAIPVFRQMIARAPDDASRSRYGLALAKLDLAGGHPKQAKSVIDSTAGSDIDPTVAASRARLSNEIMARTGARSEPPPLNVSVDPDALAHAAKRAERHGDWPLVETSLKKLVAQTVPHIGSLDQTEAQTLVQWAIAARRLHDHKTLDEIRTDYLSRAPRGKNADLLATMTAPALAPNASLSDALNQIEAIERVGDALGPGSPK